MSQSATQSWCVQKSAALLEFVTSGSRGWAQYYASDGPAFVRIGNLDHDTIALDMQDVQHVMPPNNAEGARTKLRAGDILISITAELGMVGLVPEGFGEAYINQHIALARPKPGVDARYLAWFFASEGKRQLLDMRRGMTKAGLGLDDIRNVDVLVPPLNEQRRIVAKLEALQSRSRRAREALDAVPPLLEKLRQSILAAAFRGDLTKDWRAQNPNPEPASTLLARIRTERRQKWEAAELAKLKAKGKAPTNDSWKAKYKEPERVDAAGLPELPEGWCWASLDELVVDGPTNGFSPKSEGAGAGTLTLKLSATTLGFCRLNDQTTKRTVEPIGVDEPYWLEPGDVLIQRANTLENVGVAAIFDGPRRTYIYPDLMMRIRASAIVGPRLLWRALSWEFCRKHMRDRATGTAGNMPKVNGDTVRSIPIPLPPAEELSIVLDLVDALLAKRQRLERLAADLPGNFKGLERTILAKAFRGELVPQEPNDEPADAMFARLRSEAPADSSARRASR